jgi:hypothetical protein
MTDGDSREIQQEIDTQSQRVQGLQMAVFSQADPAGNEKLLRQLAQADAKLTELRQKLVFFREDQDDLLESMAFSPAEIAMETPSGSKKGGNFLGKKTTQLRADVKLQIEPLPTGAYHLMDPETDPLLLVEIENYSREIRRVCVKAHLEGLSATAVRTIEIEPRKTETIRLQPTLFPERTNAITEVQRATLNVMVEDLDGKIETHNTYPITCLARTSSFNGVRRPDTGEILDLSHYYGAWVTPHVDTVQKLIRRAVEFVPERQMLGYQGDPEGVNIQVNALYQALREAKIVYVNSVIDYGAPAGMTTQRTRLPRESITQQSANCIDGTVLLASLMEGVSLNPSIVLVPGHAFVGWETWHGSNEWQFLETTLIGTAEFEVAQQSGQRQFEQFNKYNQKKLKRHSLKDLRSRGIWPME